MAKPGSQGTKEFFAYGGDQNGVGMAPLDFGLSVTSPHACFSFRKRLNRDCFFEFALRRLASGQLLDIAWSSARSGRRKNSDGLVTNWKIIGERCIT